MGRPLTLADGQLPAAAAAIYAGTDLAPEFSSRRVQVVCQNVGSTAETVVLTFKRANGATARRVARGQLAANWQMIVSGVPIQPDDVLLGVTSNGTTVDYVVNDDPTGTFGIVILDANGGRVGTTTSVIGGKAYVNTAASGAVTASSTETLFDKNYSIPAGTLVAGSLIKIRFQGIATATNASDTLAVKLYFGGLLGTALISIPATDATNNDVFSGEYELIIRTAGASGTMVGSGSFKSVPGAEGTITLKDDILASTAIDTTAAQVVGVSATWSSTNAGNSCRLDFLRVEIYP